MECGDVRGPRPSISAGVLSSPLSNDATSRADHQAESLKCNSRGHRPRIATQQFQALKGRHEYGVRRLVARFLMARLVAPTKALTSQRFPKNPKLETLNSKLACTAHCLLPFAIFLRTYR
jgi:hypothetical protein